jgi:hypothetical protein
MSPGIRDFTRDKLIPLHRDEIKKITREWEYHNPIKTNSKFSLAKQN